MRNNADELVAWLFERVGISGQPPVDLGNLSERMGIEAIRSVAMVEDGRLEQRQGTAVIFVREDLERGRRHFTIAHELAHRLLLHPRAPATAYRRRLTGDELERLCDDIAAAILLPRTWVDEGFAHEPRRLMTVRRMAGMSSTSLSASLVRLREIHHWPHSLLRFTFYADRWRLASPAGVPSTLHGRIRTAPTTGPVLTATTTSGDITGVLPLRLNGSDLTFPAEMSVRNGVALALVDLARPGSERNSR